MTRYKHIRICMIAVLRTAYNKLCFPLESNNHLIVSLQLQIDDPLKTLLKPHGNANARWKVILHS